MVFQSPSTHEALHLLKSPLYTKLSNKVFLPMFQNDSLLTELTTMIDLLNLSQRKGSSSSHLMNPIGSTLVRMKESCAATNEDGKSKDSLLG